MNLTNRNEHRTNPSENTILAVFDRHPIFPRLLPYLCLILLAFLGLWLYVGRYGELGSQVDWLSQHSVIPDYFRKQFYATGKLFPEFAASLGGGQNIYNFSYYGLYNPIILFSYLLPFVSMGDYIMASSVVCLIASILLFYHWLKKKEFSTQSAFFSALLFLLAAPMIYQSCKQIMFVNYMPFLCLGFYGVDRHFDRRKSGFLTVSIFLMIMTSFYFSIGGMFVLTIYALYRFFDQMPARLFFAEAVRFFLAVLTAILMSAVLLVPTAASLFGNRESNTSSQGETLQSLLTPSLTLPRVLYGSYGIGFCALIFVVLFAGLFYKKASEKFLAWTCLIVFSIPLFVWLLNGGLYMRDKVLIPFIPLLCYMTACYLEKQKRKEIRFAISLAPYVLTLVLLFASKETLKDPVARQWALIDGILLLTAFLLFWKRRFLAFLVLPSAACLVMFSLYFNDGSHALKASSYQQVTNVNIGKAIDRILKEDKGYYRIEEIGEDQWNQANVNRIWNIRQNISSIYSSSYNTDYWSFQRQVMQQENPSRNILVQSKSRNPLFQCFMGVKYILSDSAVPGYTYDKTVHGISIYKNDNATPVCYATNQLISSADYQKLPYPYNQTALLRYAVIGDFGQSKEPLRQLKQGFRKATVRMTSQSILLSSDNDSKTSGAHKQNNQETTRANTEDFTLKYSSDGYHITAKKDTTISLNLDGLASGNLLKANNSHSILFLRFRVKNNHPSRDFSIWLNQSKNTLTSKKHIYYNQNTMFAYTVCLNSGTGENSITFGKGDYEITDLECYLFSPEQSVISTQKKAKTDDTLCQSVFQPDEAKTKDNIISGSIQVKHTGYFITSIPYDNHFEIRVDGKKTIYEKVNTAFLGFPIASGKHTVEIIYHAPGLATGKILSLAGLFLFILMQLWKKRSPHHQKMKKKTHPVTA